MKEKGLKNAWMGFDKNSSDLRINKLLESIATKEK